MPETLVCVTGASGFIGSHITRALLDRGHGVRACVRDPSDGSKVDHLRAMGEIELVGADLTRAGSFDEAALGCSHVIHTAAPVRLTARDPQREIVDVALAATRNVLEGSARAGSVGRIVFTSSVAAVGDHTRPEGHVSTESDWNEHSTLDADPYQLAKTLAEREAASLQARHGSYDLVAINPGVVYGPVMIRSHLRSSPALLRGFLTGRLPGAPRMSLPLVDVGDVVDAHLAALTKEDPSPRYICVGETLWMQDVARVLARRFPDRRIPTRALPNLLVYVNALFDKHLNLTFLRRNLGRFHRFDNSLIREELGIAFRPLEESIVETARSIIEKGWD